MLLKLLSPNFITLVRVGVAFLSVALFGRGLYANVAALALLVAALAMDAVDGYVARRFKLTSDIGAAFDIAADRVVESVYWIFFASAGLISFWIPAVVIARGCLTDFLRAVAFTQGQTAFGEKTMMRSWWGRMLTGSRLSRASYGVVKCAAFFLLGLWLTLADTASFPAWREMLAAGLIEALRVAALMLAGAAVALCVVRGVPVMIEGLRFFRTDTALPKLWS
jgi:CDP-diacylglycerol---glycerol-3-phosphate 3-phosphatidyltransferase